MIAAFVLASVLATQQPAVPNRDCLDDNLTDRCASDAQAATRRLLSLRSIEEEAAAGAEVYRALYVDGYGKELPSVSFERRPGRSPEVVVYGLEGASMRAPVSADLWAEVRSQSALADRDLVDLPQPQPLADRPRPIPPGCLHSWAYTVEMANSSRDRRTVTPVRTRTEGGCREGLTNRFASLLSEKAVEAIHPCGVLEQRNQRSYLHILQSCMALKGDLLTAAQLRNEVQTIGPRYGLNPNDPGAWRAAIGTNGSPVLDWAGEIVQTNRGHDNRVAEFIVGRLEALQGLTFEQQTFEGLDARSGTVTGRASYSQDGQPHTAAYRQTWVWDPNLHDWMLSEWIVQPFAPAT
ncbi:MAG TPA: hypothetical protein VFF66_08250 [Brevundimonas sp.]|nr:hypothetical protein [Brevundimonas sp.]